MHRTTSRSGFALVVVVLVTAVVVITVLATTSVVALGLRRGTSDEARSYRALLLAESAMNLVRATIGKAELPPTTFSDDGGAPFGTFLTAAAATAEAGTSGGVTWSFVAPAGGTGTLSLEAIGTVGGAVARVLHDFTVEQVQDVLSLNAPAALTSVPRITVSGNATVSGLSSDEGNWVRELGVVPTGGWTFGLTGETTTITTTEAIAGAVRSDEYLRMDGETLRVDWAPSDGDGAFGSNQLRLTRVTPDQATGMTVLAETAIEHAPFAVTGQVSAGSDRIPITYPGFYREGDDLVLQTIDGGGIAVDTTVRVHSVVGNDLVLTSALANDVTEGTIVRRAVLGAITNSTLTMNGGGTVVGGYLSSGEHLDRETLFVDTFNTSIDTYEGLARAAGTYYTDWSAVPGSNARRDVSGITFVDYSTTQNIRFCGTGVLIVRGNLQTNNTADCDFSGLIYVTGDWDEKGNRSLIGAVVVEGLVTCSGQACTTAVAGTGTDKEDKLRYDPFALYSVALDQFPANLNVEPTAGTWRQR